jgi:prepilin-type N-terminal cleavage/methylation domain-containing protein
MLSVNADRHNLGFTTIEMITVLAIAGILAAISAPSFIAMNNRTKLRNAANDLNNSLQEIQRSAIRTSKSCTVTLPTSGTTNPTINSSCLIAGNVTLKDIQIRHNIPSISFNYRGDAATSTATKGTIVFSLPDGTKEQKCLVISPGIGLMRTGNYNPLDRTGTDSNNCTAS